MNDHDELAFNRPPEDVLTDEVLIRLGDHADEFNTKAIVQSLVSRGFGHVAHLPDDEFWPIVHIYAYNPYSHEV